MAVRHHAGHQLDRRTQTLNHGPDNGGASLYRANDSQQLLDEIVQQEGLEYATEVVIARQFIVRCYESDPLVVTLQYQNEDYGYGYRSETYNEFDLRLRKHLSLAEETCWQRCADKLIAALPGITKVRRPFIALNLPENPKSPTSW